MPGVPVDQAPNTIQRQQDISSWPSCDTTELTKRAKREYSRRKAAIEVYFSSEIPVEEIERKHHLRSGSLLRMVRRCQKQHDDGDIWGFRALVRPSQNSGATDKPDTDQLIREECHPEQSEGADSPENEILSEAKDDTTNLDTTTDLADETSSTSSEPASLDTIVALDEEDEDTGKRQAVRADGIAVIPETPLPAVDEISAVGAGEDGDEGMGRLRRPPTDNQDTDEGMGLPAETSEGGEISAVGAGEDAEEGMGRLRRPPTDNQDTDEGMGLPAETSEGDETSAVGAGEDEDEEMGSLRRPQSDNEDIPNGVDVGGAAAATDASTTTLAPTGEDHVLENETETALAESTGEESTLPLPGGGIEAESAPFAVKMSRVGDRRTARSRVLQRRKERATGRKRRRRVLITASVAALVVLLIAIALPLGSGLAAYSAYTNVDGLAHDGLNHLLDAKSLLHFSKTDPTAILNTANLQRAQSDFQTSESDFMQLQQLVNQPGVQSAVTRFAPQYSSDLGMAQHLVQVGLDVSRMGQELSGVGIIAANILHSSPLASNSSKPLISPADVNAVEAAITHALYYIGDVQAQMSQVSINKLPISASQKGELSSLLGQLPGIEEQLVQAQGDTNMVSWLLGVGQPRRFLIQTMDTAELRPGGGFTGDYGVVEINNGRMSPFSLTDVTLIDYAENGTAIGRTAPPGYSWMNFGNWGVRDSNLSGDFPTTARMTMQLFEQEGGGPVDGDIALTPAVIAHVMYATGPIYVPGYNIKVTPQNLEYWIHYYQQNPLAISQEKQISGNYSHAGRKAFTGTLGKILLDRVRHLPPSKLMGVFKQALKDIQSRDLEIYFSDPVAEAWLVDHGYSGTLSTFSSVDGFTVIQANISISKASQYVQTTTEDDVTLDASGGATHNLTITLNYQQTGPVYGYDTYADYIRVYAPPDASFLGGDGFDTGHALCTPTGTSPNPPGGSTPTPTPGGGKSPTPGGNCAQYQTNFPSSARYCPTGDYSLGERGYISGKGYTLWPYDALGAPTALTSDLPGRSMWGGLTETPKNCTSYIWLSWYVPHAVKKVNGQPVYTILVQKQSGVSPVLILRIDASAVRGLRSFTFNSAINTDRQFVLQAQPKK